MAGEAYEHGHMDISQNRATFHNALKLTKWACLAIAVIVLATTIWFCTDGGFMGGAFAGLVVTVAGVFLLSEKKRPPVH